MGRPGRRETDRLIARDDSDGDDTVVIATTGRNNRSRYHETRECSCLANARDIERWSRSKAQLWNRPPCKRCVLEDVERVTDQRTPLRQLLANGQSVEADDE
jgi:hypothetical protein